MRKRKLWWVLAGLAVLVAAVAVVFWPRPISAGVTQENFDRVEVGMTRPEVEALLGKSGDFEGGGLSVIPPSGILPAAHPDRGTATWYDHKTLPLPPDGRSHACEVYFVENLASVSFDASGRVSGKYSEKLVVRDPVSLQSLLWRTERQWRKWFPEQ